jgi:hypothetical protein
MNMDTPVLLIAWRRPHTMRQVIDAIRPVAPTRLFVACDGPNPERPGEAEKVAKYYHPVLRMDGTEVDLGVSKSGGACGVWVEQDGQPVIEMRAPKAKVLAEDPPLIA